MIGVKPFIAICCFGLPLKVHTSTVLHFHVDKTKAGKTPVYVWTCPKTAVRWDFLPFRLS